MRRRVSSAPAPGRCGHTGGGASPGRGGGRLPRGAMRRANGRTTHQPQVPDHVALPRLPGQSSAKRGRRQRPEGDGQGRPADRSPARRSREFTKAKRRPGVRGRGGAGGAAGWRGAAAPARLGALRHSAGQLSGMGWKAGKRPSGRRVGGRCGKQRMGWPAAGGSRHAEPVQGSGAAAVRQRDRRGTYQCVPREHLQQRDEVVSIPQVLVEVVDVTLRLRGWGWRYGGARGAAEPCRAPAPPPLCCPPCPTPAGTKMGQPGWEPSDPPYVQQAFTRVPTRSLVPPIPCPCCQHTPASPPHALWTSGRAGSGITPPHAGTRCPPCRRPWGPAPAWGGESVRRKRAWWGQPERERPTSARQCCAGRGREKRERLGEAAERRQPQSGQGAAGTCPGRWHPTAAPMPWDRCHRVGHPACGDTSTRGGRGDVLERARH